MVNILNTRDLKQLKKTLHEQFGFEGELNYAFILAENNKLYLISKELARVDYQKLRVDKWGLYFGEQRSDGIRLSPEGAQLLGKKITKNVVDLTKEEVQTYFLGEDLDKECAVEGNPYVILKYKSDVVGCAKYKEKRILNYHPKAHRTAELIIN